LIFEMTMGLMTIELGAGALVTLSGLRGGAAGRPLIGLSPCSVADALGTFSARADAEEDGMYENAGGFPLGAYANTVDVEMLVTV
jgi:hypothetical protein